MSDLTRRVLNEFHDWWKVHREDSIDALSDPGRDLIHAAPVLARQVEAVEALADWLENEADAEAARGDTWDAQCIRDEGRRIRNALTEAEKAD